MCKDNFECFQFQIKTIHIHIKATFNITFLLNFNVLITVSDFMKESVGINVIKELHYEI